MCSRILPRKGFQYAIEAISELELDWQVNIVGEGPYLEELKKKAKASKTPIKFWGWLDKSDSRFYNLFVTSAIFIFPSEAENFPTVLLEAMSAGMAIITSTAGGCPEVVGSKGILVEPNDVKGIRNSILKLINDEKLRHKLSKEALLRVKQFSWNHIAEKYCSVYKEVINKTYDK
jgi:glycosyltransferase involved in cell wall biosynthesis